MKSIFVRLCLAAALTFSAGYPAGAQAAPATEVAQTVKPWADADIDELESIIKTNILPLVNNANKAVMVTQSDPPSACALARDVQTQTLDTDRRLKALTARITAEGKDTSRLTEVNAKMAELMIKVPPMVQQICSGGLSNVGDPAAQAVLDKLMGYVRRYTSALTASLNAQEAGDTKTACARRRDALAALSDLEAYVKTLQAKYDDTAGSGQIRDFAAKVVKWKAEAQEELAKCPVA